MEIFSRILLELSWLLQYLETALKHFDDQPKQPALFSSPGGDEDRLLSLRTQYERLGKFIKQLEESAARTRNDQPQGGDHEKSVSTPSEPVNRR